MPSLILIKITRTTDDVYFSRTGTTRRLDRFVFSVSYRGSNDDVFLVYKDRDETEGLNVVTRIMNDWGYSTDEIETQHLY